MKPPILYRPSDSVLYRKLCVLLVEAEHELVCPCKPWCGKDPRDAYQGYSGYRVLVHFCAAIRRLVERGHIRRYDFLLAARNEFGESGHGFSLKCCEYAFDTLDQFLQGHPNDLHDSAESRILSIVFGAVPNQAVAA